MPIGFGLGSAAVDMAAEVVRGAAVASIAPGRITRFKLCRTVHLSLDGQKVWDLRA
jgi:hypothetical protein